MLFNNKAKVSVASLFCAVYNGKYSYRLIDEELDLFCTYSEMKDIE